MSPPKVVAQISRIHEGAHRLILRELEVRGVEGIVPSHGDILHHLFQEDRLPMAELAERIGRTRATVTALVDKLEARGFVVREQDEEDRRVWRVGLTDRGRDLRSPFEAVSGALNRRLLEGFGEEEIRVLEGMLERLRGNLRED